MIQRDATDLLALPNIAGTVLVTGLLASFLVGGVVSLCHQPFMTEVVKEQEPLVKGDRGEEIRFASKAAALQVSKTVHDSVRR